MTIYNWKALEEELTRLHINGISMEMARNLVNMMNKNPNFKGTASPTACDAKPLIRYEIIQIDKNNRVSFTDKALKILNS